VFVDRVLGIINDDLLAGMKTVGELFGLGQMQLPFVLQSAEAMKTAVAHLEPNTDSPHLRLHQATDRGLRQRVVRRQLLPRLPRGARYPQTVEEYFKLGYRGARYSFGHGAAQIWRTSRR
jgi:cobalamin-dependent methionine synthase I